MLKLMPEASATQCSPASKPSWHQKPTPTRQHRQQYKTADAGAHRVALAALLGDGATRAAVPHLHVPVTATLVAARHGVVVIASHIVAGVCVASVVALIQAQRLLLGRHAQDAQQLEDEPEGDHHAQHPACTPRSISCCALGVWGAEEQAWIS